MPSALHGVCLKIGRANEHLKVLEREIGSFVESHMSRIVDKFETESEETTREVVDLPSFDDRWSILIGEFAYNLLAALDHLMWQLVILNTPPEIPTEGWPPSLTKFPIVAQKSHWDKVTRQTRNLRCEHARKIKELQPRKRGDAAEDEPLWLLFRLRNIDAHQVLHTGLIEVDTTSLIESFEFVRSGDGFAVIGIRTFTKDGPPEGKLRTVAPIPLALGDNLKITATQEGNLPLLITFDQRGTPIHNQEVLPLLRRCRDEVQRIIDLFAPDFA